MNCPYLVTGDGNLDIWGALSNVYPNAPEQRCWNHKVLNVLDKLPRKLQPKAKRQLQDVVYSPSRQEAVEKRALFVRWGQRECYHQAV